MTLRLGLLGVGRHCRREHLPALERCLDERGAAAALAAVCDLNRTAAEQVAATFQAEHVFDDLDAMLRSRKIDALIAVTPMAATARLAMRVMDAGVPLLMEKPLGATLAEARAVVHRWRTTATPTMVGMNRRFAAGLVEARDWLDNADIRYARASILRRRRLEANFVEDAVLHVVDLLESIMGGVSKVDAYALGDGMGSAVVGRLRFASDASATVEALPHVGAWHEGYEFAGPGFRVRADFAGGANGWWDDQPTRTVQPAADLPDCVKGGTYGETAAFIDALLESRPPRPTPADVLPAMVTTAEIAAAIRRRRKPSGTAKPDCPEL